MLTRYRIWPNLNYFYVPTTGTVYSENRGKHGPIQWVRRGQPMDDYVRISSFGNRVARTRRQILDAVQPQIDKANAESKLAIEKEIAMIKNPHRTDAAHAAKGFIVGSIRGDGTHSISAKPKYHGTYAEASTEAARLATQNPGVKFMVLTVGGIVSVGAATWE